MSETPKPALLENWTGWLQARIPALKESHNVYWLKQAFEGYKSDSTSANNAQVEPTNGTDHLPSASEYLKEVSPFATIYDREQVAMHLHNFAELVRQNEREKWNLEREELLVRNIKYGHALFEMNTIQEAREYIRKTFEINQINNGK